MAEPLIPVQTIRYKQYVKETIVEALGAVFAAHPDKLLRNTHVGVDFPMEEAEYPAIVVRFYEREIKNAGVAHVEHLEAVDPQTGLGTGEWYKYRHQLYNGDIEFAIHGLSSYDRDLLADSLVQILTMADTETYTDLFMQRIYRANELTEPTSVAHFINLNTDKIMGFGETQQMAPWGAEDVMIYSTSYRIGIFGEIYSRTPTNTAHGLVEKVEVYPYAPTAGETVPDPKWAGPDDVHGTPDDQVDPDPWLP